MGTSKILIDGIGIDLTADTVAANKMLSGIKAHDSNGDSITGSIQTWAGQQASGVKTITANGTYDVAQFASAAVDVLPTNMRRWDISISADIIETDTRIHNDGWIAQHYSDDGLVLTLHAKDWSGTDNRVLFIQSGNKPFMTGQNRSGLLYRRYNNTDGVQYPRLLSMSNQLNSLSVRSNGDIYAKASTSAHIVAGDYVLIGFLV